MRFATAFSLLLATVASVPASVLALPHDFAGGVELEARTRGAEPPYYARRSLEDIKLFLRSLDDDELLAVREAANLRWFDARGFDEAELEARGGDSPPPPYRTHDPVNGSKPKYRKSDPWPGQGHTQGHTQGHSSQGHTQGPTQSHSESHGQSQGGQRRGRPRVPGATVRFG